MSSNDNSPITPAQAQARRDNGKRHSTGPRTDEGKRASSRNAIKLGLYARANPVVEGGLFAEDPDAFAVLRDSVHLSYDPRTVIEELLVDELASVLWRLYRIPMMEAIVLSGQAFEHRWADRHREDIQELLKVEDYLRHPGDTIDDDLYFVVAGAVHCWAGWEMGEGWDSDDAPPVTRQERRDLIGQLLTHRWSTWDEAADHALTVAQETDDNYKDQKRQDTAKHLRRLLAGDTLTKLVRAESHLSRERDRILTQLRAEQAKRTEASEEED